MVGERFILAHPVQAQTLLNKNCPREELIDKPTLVVVMKADSSTNASVDFVCSQAAAHARKIRKSDDLVSIDRLEGSERILAFWSENESDLVEKLAFIWTALQQLGKSFHGAIGIEPYPTICSLRMGPVGQVVVQNEVYVTLDNEAKDKLMSMGYQKVDHHSSAKTALWTAFQKAIDANEPEPELLGK